ncbi:MAG: tRNA (adenosine(37)-N6)-threonylcarbamoyltransferase complex transferase subunit TsaD [Ruminococcaceae bacterium]|nr:tRNA (adenosine(37)-N6)-threonylcarbamoyltransferase complex transferase subunit TsaD [Oscillospiraceae bacterium]
MLILGIESSCDETAAAVVRDGREILSDVVASQIDIHRRFGGVVPEIASRCHAESIVSVTDEAIKKAGITADMIDAVAVTYAPGLIGALLVGIGFAKSFAYAMEKPLVPVHHIRGHVAANYLASPELEPPFLALIVSGGHTTLCKVESYTEFKILGQTRDDAAGEAFDKVGRLLGLEYPGGAKIDRLANEGNDKAIKFPRPHVDGAPLDLSFSGLKTAAVNMIHNAEQKGEAFNGADIAASFRAAVVDMLISRLDAAITETGMEKVVLAGGVAANSLLRVRAEQLCANRKCKLFVPPLSLCGDNGAMIASQGYYEFLAGVRADTALNGCPTKRIDAQYV